MNVDVIVVTSSEFSKSLAKGMDIYVNDAFGTAHRAHASTAGVASFIPIRVAGNLKLYIIFFIVSKSNVLNPLLHLNVIGFLMEKEVYHLKDVINKPVRPFAAIVGGSKLSTKLKLLNGLVDRADMIYISGAVRFTFYKALGYPVGK